jgi:hypothetical protein
MQTGSIERITKADPPGPPSIFQFPLPSSHSISFVIRPFSFVIGLFSFVFGSMSVRFCGVFL